MNRLPPQGARVVDQDVDATKTLHRLSHHSLDLIAVANVNLNRQRGGSECFHFFGHGMNGSGQSFGGLHALGGNDDMASLSG